MTFSLRILYRDPYDNLTERMYNIESDEPSAHDYLYAMFARGYFAQSEPGNLDVTHIVPAHRVVHIFVQKVEDGITDDDTTYTTVEDN